MLRSIMRAIRVHKFGGPEVLQVETAQIPRPEANEVLVKVKAAGVNPVDTYVRQGSYGPKEFPYIPGADAAGVVEAVGNGVTNVQVGDRVFCNGASGSYCEFIVAKAVKVFRLPERLSFSQGAALPVPYFTALRALTYKAHAQPGETVLVHGASGGVGIAACQIASGLKMHVVGTASTDEGAKLVKDNGASAVLNHKDPNHAENLKKATNGKGFDVILEMLANVNLATDMDIVAERGRIVVIGSRGKIEIDPRAIMQKESLCTAVALMKSTDQEWQEMGATVLQGIEAGWINPIVDEEYPLDKAGEAHKAVIDHGSGSKGKIVIVI
ncbi:quinone oxidoreductase-like [Paramacrobiotus metropolitanus]|uniref:quinone oxidoreductase-like n=1 Tax=Paramacrobiotus metropolitanus TaxID=2943436 RepID=UPI0024456EB0|nr:quinone oxidoreductase-like [Paramacrobiotus metropolitanus]